MRTGEILTLVGPGGTVYRARLVSLTAQEALVVPFEKRPSLPEDLAHLSVYQALPRKERFELVLEKLTELGVDRIVPFVSRHSVTLEERDAGQRKSHRWPEVIKRAARQCRRDRLPELAPVMHWSEILTEAAHADLRMMLYEGSCKQSLGEIVRGSRGRRIALLVGPEGGFSRQEVGEAEGAGMVPVSLGRHILRTETASIAGAAIIQFCLGEL